MVSANQFWTVSLCIRCYYHAVCLAAAMNQQYKPKYSNCITLASSDIHLSILQVVKILQIPTSHWTSQLERMSPAPFLFAQRMMSLLSFWRTSLLILTSDMKLSIRVLAIMAQSRFLLKITTVSVVPIHNSYQAHSRLTLPISIDLSMNTWSVYTTGVYCT